MFGLFKSKDENIKARTVVWMTEQIKFEALDDDVAKYPGMVIVAWFEDTFDKLKRFFSFTTSRPDISMARELNFHHVENRHIVFAEHYPLSKKEMELFEKLRLKEPLVYSSLDEPLVRQFAGDRLQDVMRKMGMKEDEPIEHAMITAAFSNLQRKIAKKILVEQPATSQEDWLFRNMPAKKI